MELVRHFTATAFVVHDGSVALHWHQKVKAWLPPGGHIEPNEDPVQAVLREILEETALKCEVVPTGETLNLEYPTHVDAPYTIMIEDIHDPVQGFHHHIDMIYFCRPVVPVKGISDGWLWVTKHQLLNNNALTLTDGSKKSPPEDVRTLGVRAIDFLSDS
ncbi:MAG: NUDIX domain-containing protein [SAR202 cluster bacterium]|nr:NUDIX domain-containing protein [SAR202 cluster bacterium]MDP6714288.1 NUDIX domain-containing protein [SAR202 cluster bacterium]